MSNNWKKYKLGELSVKITKGTTPSTVGRMFLSSGINYIKSEAVGYDGRIDKSTFVYIDEQTHEKLKRSQLEEDDILFSMAGAFLGKTGMVTVDMLPANTNQANAIIRLNKLNASPKFIHYFLRLPETVRYVNNMSAQSAQPNINLEEIGSLEVNLPPLPEQQAIAEILSSLDDKIELNLQTNKSLEEMANALYKHWFVDFGTFKDGKFVESELGLIPEGWEVSTFKNLVGTIVDNRGKTPPISENIDKYILIETFQLTDDFIFPDLTNSNKNKYVSEETYNSKFRKGHPQYLDILFATVGNGIPNWSFAPDRKDICIAQNLIGIRARKGVVTQSFLKYSFDSNLFLEQFDGYVITTAQPSIKISDLNLIKMILPPISIITKFDDIILPLIEQQNSNFKENELLKQTRDYLLPKLISGDVRVKDAEKAVKEVI